MRQYKRNMNFLNFHYFQEFRTAHSTCSKDFRKDCTFSWSAEQTLDHHHGGGELCPFRATSLLLTEPEVNQDVHASCIHINDITFSCCCLSTPGSVVSWFCSTCCCTISVNTLVLSIFTPLSLCHSLPKIAPALYWQGMMIACPPGIDHEPKSSLSRIAIGLIFGGMWHQPSQVLLEMIVPLYGDTRH